MKQVFLSYAREDLEIAQKIYDDLTDKGEGRKGYINDYVVKIAMI
jgi:hypothetical protein